MVLAREGALVDFSMIDSITSFPSPFITATAVASFVDVDANVFDVQSRCSFR
jgi:hypothetical protein